MATTRLAEPPLFFVLWGLRAVSGCPRGNVATAPGGGGAVAAVSKYPEALRLLGVAQAQVSRPSRRFVRVAWPRRGQASFQASFPRRVPGPSGRPPALYG